LTITELTTPSLGELLAGASGRNFILNTDETVTGVDAVDYLCCAVSGRLRLRQTGGAADANIVADNITTTGGVTVNAVPCRFHQDTQTTCDGAGIDVILQGNRNLFVGVDIDTTQVHVGGDTASVTYDINVTIL
jgi:hypothetical protein